MILKNIPFIFNLERLYKKARLHTLSYAIMGGSSGGQASGPLTPGNLNLIYMYVSYEILDPLEKHLDP